MTVLVFFKPILENKMSILEEYGTTVIIINIGTDRPEQKMPQNVAS